MNSINSIQKLKVNKKDFILLPGRKHGYYRYPDLDVSMSKLSLDEEVKEAAEKLGYKISNNKHGYIGSLDFYKFHSLLNKINYQMLTLRQGIDLILLLEKGISSKIEVVYSDGKKIESKILENLRNELVGESTDHLYR